MTRARIESLLASFPKLIPTNSQHTSVETAEVRYVYQPLEELYILLITNKASNILQDIDTLHLFARVVSDLCKSVEEREIQRQSFELLGAFDEIVSLGYREHVNLMQVRSVLEMESHEEKIQEIIARVSTTIYHPPQRGTRSDSTSVHRTRKPKQKRNSSAVPANSRCNAENNKNVLQHSVVVPGVDPTSAAVCLATRRSHDTTRLIPRLHARRRLHPLRRLAHLNSRRVV